MAEATAAAAVAQVYEDALDDVHTRFILNLPPEEMATSDRIFFQLEQAYWFYDDFHCDNSDLPLPRFKALKPFAHKMFQMSPLLSMKKFDKMWEEFTAYKRHISTYGTILLNSKLTKMVLCQAWKSNSWTFPAGKVNQHENGTDAAARETYEETGFDPNCTYGETKKMQERSEDMAWQSLQEEDALLFLDSGKRRTMYVCANVPEDFDFMPVARKEVEAVEWHDIDEIPKKSFSVLPFMKQLRRWIKKNGKKPKNNSTPGRKRPASRKKPRSQNTSRSRVSQNDPLTESGLAAAGEINGWTEADMFKANEPLLLNETDDAYDGNPHRFAERGFEGKDPHHFHVVGGTLMNSEGISPSLFQAPRELQPLVQPGGSEKVLQPFFPEGVATTVVDEKTSKSAKQQAGKDLLMSLQSGPASANDDMFMTDKQVTARSQGKKLPATEPRGRKKHMENLKFIDEWVASKKSTATESGFRFDVDAITRVMNEKLM